MSLCCAEAKIMCRVWRVMCDKSFPLDIRGGKYQDQHILSQWHKQVNLAKARGLTGIQ